MENAKIPKFKCDIWSNFQTMWKQRKLCFQQYELCFEETKAMCCSVYNFYGPSKRSKGYVFDLLTLKSKDIFLCITSKYLQKELTLSSFPFLFFLRINIFYLNFLRRKQERLKMTIEKCVKITHKKSGLRILIRFNFVVFSFWANFSPGLLIIWFTKQNTFSMSSLPINFSILSF